MGNTVNVINATESFRRHASFGAEAPTRQALIHPKENLDENLRQLQMQAEQAGPLLPAISAFVIAMARKDLESVGSDHILDEEISYRHGNIKAMDRMFKKVTSQYNGDAEKLSDIARCWVKGNNGDEIAALSACVEYLYENQVDLPYGARIVKVSNRFINPTDYLYSSIKTKVAVPIAGEPGYHICEMMVVHEEFERLIEAEKNAGSHKLYERIQEVQKEYSGVQLPEEVSDQYSKDVQDIRQMHQEARDVVKLDQIDFELFREIRMENHLAALRSQSPDQTWEAAI